MKLGYLIFGASETLFKSLQGKDTALQEALAAVNLAKAFYKRQWTDEAFCRFYDQVVETAEKVEIAGPELPRNRRTPARLDDGRDMLHQNIIFAINTFRLVIYLLGNWKTDFSNVICYHLLYPSKNFS